MEYPGVGLDRFTPHSPPISTIVFMQALDVTLREPDMEMSTQQAGANRFDDPGVAGALAGDADLEGPGGVQASLRVKCGKLEPEVPVFLFVFEACFVSVIGNTNAALNKFRGLS